MALLEGKTALVLGVRDDHSIGWGIAQAFKEQGADVGLSYASEREDVKVHALGKKISSRLIESCDVTRAEDITRLMREAKDTFNTLDIIVHSIAYANPAELKKEFSQVSDPALLEATIISAYSLKAVVSTALDAQLLVRGSSVLATTFHASQQVFPHYHTMAGPKAVLEEHVRELAAELGPEGIRVNAVSPGPILTSAAAAIPGFRQFYRAFPSLAPLGRNVTVKDIGNVAVFLCSDLAAVITGQVINADGGYSIMANIGRSPYAQKDA